MQNLWASIGSSFVSNEILAALGWDNRATMMMVRYRRSDIFPRISAPWGDGQGPFGSEGLFTMIQLKAAVEEQQ
jgi:hypothetical protein